MNRQRRIDCRFAAEITVFVLALYGISACVYLNGDDFMYGAFSRTGIFDNVIHYYFSGNGRFWINILDAALLRFDRFGFILVLPWIVLAFVVLLAKNVQRIMAGRPDAGKEKELIRMGMVLFCCLDVLCLRETVFWITGMVNYLLPAVLFLWAYLMYQKAGAGALSGASKLGFILLCLLTASSVEQYALMFVGMMTLHNGLDLIRKRRVSGLSWLAYAVSLAGLAALILAPGNFVRVDEQGGELPSVIHNAWTLVFQDVSSPVALPFVIMLSLAGMPDNGSPRKGQMLYWAVSIVFLVGTIAAPIIDKAVFYIALLAVIGCLLVSPICRGRVPAAPIWFLLFVGAGSQIMLLISAVWGYRCMLSLYLVYMLVIGCALYHADGKRRLMVLASGILASFHPAATLVFWILVFISGRKWDLVRRSAAIITCCGSAAALLILLAGYGRNVETHQMNLQSTAAPANRTIVIRELPDDTYSWYFVPIGEFHEEYYRILYDIPETVEIIYQESPSM